jgi:hypothetical protein
VAQAGSLSKGGRVAVQDEKGQGAVWEEVGELNASSGVDTESDAFTANYTSPEMQKQLDDYRLTLETPIAEQKQVVGAIIAINGKVEAVDVFQSTPLFRKLWPVLLKSYALDAAVCAKEPSADAVCTLQDAKEFIDLAMKADVAKTSQAPGGLVVTKRDSNRVMSFSTTDWSATESGDAAAGSGMGGFGGAVHSSGFRK